MGDRYAHVCVLDAEGEVVEEGRVSMKRAALRGRFAGMSRCRIAMEVGTHSPWVSRLLSECGHQVLVANPRKLRAIYENDAKDDRVDAQMLARLARVDPHLLCPIEHRGEAQQAALAVLHGRDALVKVRTQLINGARGRCKSVGYALPKCSTESFHRKAAAEIPAVLKKALEPLVKTLEAIDGHISGYDREIERLAKEVYPDAELLRSMVDGVGALTALAFVVTLQDPARFRSSRSVGPYLGLRPRKRQSGKADPQLHITKGGDVFLRRLLVGSAHYILGPFGPDTDLRRWGLALAERGGKNAKKRAVVAVARKLAVLLHRLWTTGEVYEPLREARRRAELAA